MSVEYSHEDLVDIIDILYIKTFRLRTSWDFLALFVFNGNMENHYPDLTYSLKYSFGIDAYTTVDALLSSGKYTYYTLKKLNSEFDEEYRKARAALKEVIPKIEWNRNKLFCHFVEKQSEAEINEIVLDFPRVFDILAELQMAAMRIFNVDKSEIRVMPEDKYIKLQEEKAEFSHLLMEGILNEDFRQVLNNA